MSKTFIIDLVSKVPFAEKNPSVIHLLKRLMGFLSKNKEIMDCQEVWSLPPLPFSSMVKYTADAMKFVEEYVASGKSGLYGIHDWNIIRKGQKGNQAYINIRVMCAEDINNPHHFGYSISMIFQDNVAKILMKEGLIQIVEEMARELSADIGRIDYINYYGGGGILSSDSLIISTKRMYPEDNELTGMIPGVAWWTLLSAQHFSKLGGKNMIIKQAPCFTVHDLSTDIYKALALQLSPDPFSAREEDYVMLRQYLKPILPSINVYSVAYEMKAGRLPLSRIEQLVTPEELSEAQKLCTQKPKELYLKSMQYKDAENNTG